MEKRRNLSGTRQGERSCSASAGLCSRIMWQERRWQQRRESYSPRPPTSLKLCLQRNTTDHGISFPCRTDSGYKLLDVLNCYAPFLLPLSPPNKTVTQKWITIQASYVFLPLLSTFSILSLVDLVSQLSMVNTEHGAVVCIILTHRA